METVYQREDSWNKYQDNFENRTPKLNSPTPLDKEIILDNNKMLLSITDTRGIITYCNEDFVETSEYQEWELAGAAHNIIRHPDMPRVVFKLMWSRIQNGDNIIAIVKNLAKSGRYYWVMTDFVIKEDANGNVTGYKAYRRPAPRKAIEAVTPLYKKLIKIEEVKGMDAAEDFLIGYLDSQNTSYDELIEGLIIDNIAEVSEKLKEVKRTEVVTQQAKQSFWKTLFRY